MKKIAFIGTHGTGKTTIGYELVSALKKLGIKVEFLREIANEAKKVGFNLNEGTTKDSQKWILHTQIAKELEYEKIVINFLNKCNINCTNINKLDEIIIERDTIIIPELYDNIKYDILELKQILNSSINTAVHKNAEVNQKWPLLNLIRQVLKYYNYDLKPKRIANGYSKDGQKKYKRYFEIKKKVNNKEKNEEIKEITIK